MLSGILIYAKTQLIVLQSFYRKGFLIEKPLSIYCFQLKALKKLSEISVNDIYILDRLLLRFFSRNYLLLIFKKQENKTVD